MFYFACPQVPPSTIYAIETGKIGNPQEKTQKKIKNALGEEVPAEVTDETEKDAQIEGFWGQAN